MLRAQYVLLAEHAREGQRGTLDYLGVFDRLYAKGLPAQHEQLVFVALLVCDTEDDLGKHTFTLTLTSPSGKPAFEHQGAFDIKPEAGTWLGSGRLVFTVRGLPLTELGKYLFVLTIDNKVRFEHPLTVAFQSPAKA